ncbi:MFS transporter [Halomarina pelagica]|uniref:MFS transporter n=1 Tax=Halomarina pelagica TaxID=2961599 RepID=UPI0020C32C90|nr:MFS transporter [Halomarina sp. BND7]
MTTSASVVLRYYLYMTSSTLGFLSPVWVVLLEDRGLSLASIALLDGVFFGVIVLSELPTGYVGDRIGRRRALVVSSLAVGAAAAGFGVAEGVGEFLVVYVAWGVAQTFRSGNDSAWLYDTLAAGGEPEAFARVRGRGLALLLGATSVASIAGGYLYALDPRYPFFATGAINLLSAAVVATVPEPPSTDPSESFTLAGARRALSQLRSPSLRSFVGYTAFFFAVGWSVDLFVQPIGTRAGLSATDLGWLYAGLTGLSAVASNYADAVATRVGVRRLIHLAPVGLGGAVVVLGFLPALAVPTFFLLRATLNLVAPVSEQYLNDRTASLGRATVLSAWSMLVSLASVPLKLVSGALAESVGPFATVAALGGLLAAGSIAVLAVERPVPTTEAEATATPSD